MSLANPHDSVPGPGDGGESMDRTIQALCDWGEPRELSTKLGGRMLRKAAPTPRFWDAWRSGKDALKTAGISVGRDDRTGEWEVCWWSPLSSDVLTHRSQSAEASRAVDADVEIPVPEGLELMPFQKAGVRYALGRRDTLMADEMGLGKTIQAIGFANVVRPASVLVVCPASLKINWQREWAKWSTLGLRTSIDSATDWDESAEVHIVNYDILAKPLLAARVSGRTWGLLVCDESHYIKNPKAARTKALLSVRAERRLFLTGTPVLNRPIELYPVLSAMRVPYAMSWTQYAKRYCAARWTGYGMDASGASNVDELAMKLRESVMVRRLKEDVLTDLPEKTISVVVLPQNGAAKAIADESRAWAEYEGKAAAAKADIARLRRDGLTETDDYRDAVKELRGCFAEFSEIARLRHQTALLKIPHVVEAAAETVDSAGCCVVFAHHKDVIEGILAGLAERGVSARAVTGDTDPAERQPIVDAFQEGNIQVFVGSIRACGTGINLTRSTNVVFAELDWTPSAMDQAADRCHRIGQHGAVLVRHLVFDGTVDSMLAKKAVEKAEVIESIMGDEFCRGVG